MSTFSQFLRGGAAMSIAVVGCLAAEFRVDSLSTTNGRRELRFSGDGGFYYILWRGNSVADIRLATDLALNGGAQSLLSDTNATTKTQFYRVEKIPLTSLRDTDGDGICDAWELLHRHPGAALNPVDADEDHDGNGVADRIDALRERWRVGVRGRPILAAGGNHTLALQTNGTLWAWGNNYFGQCGFDFARPTETNLPVQVGNKTNWANIAASGYNTIAVEASGTLWAWGNIHNSPVGPGPISNIVAVPTQIGMESNWTAVAADQSRLMALKTGGGLWSITDTAVLRVGSDNDWASINGGSSSGFMLIKNDGTLWASVGSTNLPTRVGTDSNWVTATLGILNNQTTSYAIKEDGTLHSGSPTIFSPPIPVAGESNWVAITGGAGHFVGLKTDGTLWVWGDNSFFQCGSRTALFFSGPTQLGTASNWVALAAGVRHTVALRADGSIWAWGDNSIGQLGSGAVGIVMKPTQIGADTNWLSAHTGQNSSFGIRTDRTLWAWGENRSAQLGLGHSNSLFTPTQVGSETNWLMVNGGSRHVIALKTDRSLWSWGNNSSGELGNGTTAGTSTPMRVGTNNDWALISAGIQHNLALTTNRVVWAWGRNLDGSLGLGFGSGDALQPTNVPGMSNAQAVSADYYSSVIIRGANANLWRWGRDPFNTSAFAFGGVNSDQPLLVSNGTGWVAIATSEAHNVERHILALKSDGTLWAAGNAFWGQSGLRDSTNVLTQVGSETNWASIVIGDMQSFAIKRDGTLWSWGVGGVGGRDSQETAFTPVQVGNDSDWVSVSSGFSHALAMKRNGTLWGWGKNTSGQCAQTAFFEPAPLAGTNWGAPRR